MKKLNILGQVVEEKELLRDKFIEPPFSVLDTKSGHWQARKRKWRSLGIKSELGRDVNTMGMKEWAEKNAGKTLPPDVSIFDPALCEVLYHWFVPEGGTILDPFAGGSVRGIVANYLGYKYTGIDIRPEQVESNLEQAQEILDANSQPIYYIGDSNVVLDTINDTFDFVFSCPPYADLEVYSDLEGDISNMEYDDFMNAYTSIIHKSCSKLKDGGLACFVVGEIRDKKGFYRGFVPDTISAFTSCGMKYYNEAVLLNSLASAMLRASGYMKTKKLVKSHQNILVFKK